MSTNKLKRPNFYQIPEIVGSQVKPHDSFVFSVIYWFEKMKDGRCFASNETIAEALPYKSSASSVANSLVKLEKKGFIKRIFSDEHCRIRKEIKCLVDYGVSSTGERGITHELKGVSSTGEHNNNKLIIKDNISLYPFEDFYKIYPLKKSKKKAELKWTKLDSKVKEIIMLDLPKRTKLDSQWLAGYIPHPTTYLNGELWEDEISSSKAGGTKLKVI